MDPTINPTPTPNPAPGVPPVEPPVAPVAPQPTTPVNPVVTPTQPAVNPVITPTQPVENPVVTPTNLDPVGASFQAGNLDGVAATDPIMMPEPAAKPDPIEEELKAPMKAAAPVPGSIGSAVSGPEAAAPVESPAAQEATGPVVAAPEAASFTPESAGTTPSVSFTDPATQPETNPAAEAVAPAKKSNKTTLIILVAVAAVIVVVLAVILFMQLADSNKQSNTPVSPTPTPEPTPTPVEPVESAKLSCSRTMTEDELLVFNTTNIDNTNGTLSGNIIINMEFDGDDELSTIEVYRNIIDGSLEATDENPVGNAEVSIDSVSMSVDDLSADNIEQFYLSYDENGELITSKDELQQKYEQLDFICEAL